MEQPLIQRFLDEDGRLKQWPAKQAGKAAAYAYLANQFAFDRDYTEHEVNAILASAHTFSDVFLLRRGLVESGWLLRERDGSRYWKNKDKQDQ